MEIRENTNQFEILPSMNKNSIIMTDIRDIEEEKKYWLGKNERERLTAIEINRRLAYGENRTSSRLQRFFEIVKLKDLDDLEHLP